MVLTHSKRILDGDYRAGRADSVLIDSKRNFEKDYHITPVTAVVTYASDLYSAVRSDLVASRKAPWRLLHAIYIFPKLLFLLYWETPSRMDWGWADAWTPDRCETYAAILLRFWVFGPGRFWPWADLLVHRGLQNSTESTSAHTVAFLYLHSARMRHHHAKTGHGDRASDEEKMMYEDLDAAEDYADRAADPDQKSRCYRGLAQAYMRLKNPVFAIRFTNKMDGVPNLAADTIRKNAAMRKHMGL